MGKTQGARRCCALQLALLMMNVSAGGAESPPGATSRHVAGVPTDPELEAAGAIIGDIYINNENIFNLEDPKDNTALFRLADGLHVLTRPGVIRNQLLFHSGDRYSRRVLDETERILRAHQYFYDAWILPVSYHDGQVDLRITTRDVWTLDPGFNFGRSGGTNSTGLYLEEINLAGSGTSAALGHTTTIDRSQSSVNLAHSNIFGTWIAANATYANTSDGMTRQLLVERPFYSLETHRAAGVNDYAYDLTDSLYDRGQIIDRFHDRRRLVQAYAGWSGGLQEGWVQRLSLGGTYDEHEFSPVATWLRPTFLPEDRRFVYPWVRYELLEDNYARVMNHDQIQRTEDFFLGTTLSVQVGWTDRTLGSTRSAVLFQTTAGKGFGDIDHTLLLLSTTFTGRLDDGELHNALVSGAIRYYLKQDSHWLFFWTVTGAKGWALPLDQQVLLGGDNGLRGYPLRYQDGTSRGLLTIEQRYFTDWYLLRLFRVGAAIFFDAGRTWGNPPLAQPGLGLLKDAGIGLRFSNSRSGLGAIVHVDMAFPFSSDTTIQKVQFLVQTEQSF
jgi:hypothetical protein